MARSHKFVPGAKVERVEHAVDHILMGLWLYFNDKPMHPSWMRNWSVDQLDMAVRGGRLRYALLNEAHPDNFKEVA